MNAFEPRQQAALELGFTAPETFLIDRDGIIRAKHVGPISPRIFASKFSSFLK